MAKKINFNHRIGKKWTSVTLFSAIIWGLLYQLVLVNIPLLSQLDVKITDSLIRFKNSDKTLDKIVVVKIQEQDLRDWGVLNETQYYAQTAQKLLKSGAQVLVLNLLPSWLKLAEESDSPLKSLVSQHPEQIVLVTRVTSFSLNKLPELNKYNQLFPFDSETNPLTNPIDIQGFFEYDSTVERLIQINHPARLLHLRSQFIVADNFNLVESFDSVALLALKKYQPQVVTINKPKSIYVNFNHNNFVTLEIENLDNLPKPEYLKNKIVILGFSDPSNPDSLAMLSPLGNMIPAIELQAHQIANLLTDSYFSLFPLPLQVIIIISGVIILNYLMIFLVLNNNYSYLQKIFLCLSLIIILFVAITFISYSFKFIISYSVIFLTWLLTCISILISLKFSSQRILLQEQEYELMRLRSSEQEAILAQAKKLINRLASDLHDGPLQELKVVMDDLEILEMQHDHLQLNSSLDKLEKLGIDIRKILAKKDRLSLNITPELKKGLAHGIRHKLEELKKSQKLTLQIVADLENLPEPSLSSIWFANREDIFLFFCEAMNNVIKHAQPPFGSATYVKVNLRQEQEQCVLEIINDGSMANNHHKSRKHGGYGTKLMQTVASELPSANWQRYVDENEVYVSLCWILST